MPRLIFASDMSDALSKVVTFDYLFDEVIANVTSEQSCQRLDGMVKAAAGQAVAEGVSSMSHEMLKAAAEKNVALQSKILP